MANLPPRVSVVIPTYNRANLLQEAVDSVLNQLTQVHEIIVVDDGSTDSTRELVRSYASSPVVILTQDHAGVAVARNHGLAHATGDWITFLDSDDIWTPTKLSRQLQYLEEHPQCDFVHTGYFEFGDRRKVIQPSRRFLTGDYKVEYLLLGENWICPSSVTLRKSIPMKFREWAEVSGDIIFFADILRLGIRCEYLNEPLVGHRVHAVRLNTAPKAQSRGASMQWRWVQETFASDPPEQQRLHQNLLTKALGRMKTAKWDRNWTSYWEWREWLSQHWLADVRCPDALSERIYPRALYKLKDQLTKIATKVKTR